MADQPEFDVIIVGAGLSGIGSAYHLQTACPGKRYAILEGRQAIGGTWDLFRYPGIRSDSDMFTLGYGFKPWREQKAIADGPSIWRYVNEVAQENDIVRHIRFGHQVRRAQWSSAQAMWTVEAEHAGERRQFTCRYLLMAAGYYKYSKGYTPDWADAGAYQGRWVHPQFWPQDLDYSGRKIVIIGSGATAATLLPELAKTAAQVTMLQRSPTYMVSMPSEDRRANWLRRVLPAKLAYSIIRWRNIWQQLYTFSLVRRYPERAKTWLIDQVRSLLPAGYDVAKHFTPNYNPWDQRICLVPDADLFEAIKSGKADVVTDHIKGFVADGITLASGAELKADIIVTATGLELTTAGDTAIEVDGVPVVWSEKLVYKGMMYSDIPNLVNVFGYTNASWTLKADLTAEHFCRMIKYMDTHGYVQFCPRQRDPKMETAAFADFTSGYFQRAQNRMPRQGAQAPWRLYQNYALDILKLRFGDLTHRDMEFRRAPAGTAQTARPALQHAAE